MDRIPAPSRPSDFSDSYGTRTHSSNHITLSSTCNSVQVGGNFNNTNIQPTTGAPDSSSCMLPSNVAPFNNTPVDQLSVHFTGQKKELTLIAEAFEKRRDQNAPSRCVLFGNQGVGKSQLSYAWANITYRREENSYILWISATTIEKLYQGFSRLLRLIDHPDYSQVDESVRLRAARRWLEGVDAGNWLLILDNVFPETLEFLQQNLPRQNGRGTIMFTTQTERVALALASTAEQRHNIIEVPSLDVKAGVELFCAHFESGTIRVDPASPKIEAIVIAVGRLPLAISHGAGYMIESHSSLDDVLKLYQSTRNIDVISWDHTLSDDEHKSVAATFMAQLQDLNHRCPDANKLLAVLSFFNPDGIPLEMLPTGAKAIVDEQPPLAQSPSTASLLALIHSPIAHQNAIARLQARRLVTLHASSESPTLHIHDLIQLMVLEITKSSGLDQELFNFAVELASAAFEHNDDDESDEWWPRCELLVPHIQHIHSLTLRLDASSRAKEALLRANYRQGLYLGYRGRYAEAESLCSNTLADMEQLFGPNDPETLDMMDELAHVYDSTGRFVDAETLFGRVLESRRTHDQLGPEHPDTLQTMYRLAQVYFHQQRFDDAEIILQQALQSRKSQSGLEGDDALSTMVLLADVYNELERYDEAESLLTRILQTQEKLLGVGHARILHTKYTLACVYRSQERYDTAGALLQQVLCGRETTLGSQHLDTLAAMYSLARVHTLQGRYRDAENLLVRVLETEERILGLSHSYTQETVSLLAEVYEELGQSDDAEMLKQHIASPSP